jgi:four helix bundle protein
MRENLIKTKSFALAVKVVNIYKEIKKKHNETVLSKQLLRSGTSIAANVREAIDAQSSKDFVNKFSISQKEANETMFWLELLKETDYIDKENYDKLIDETKQVYRIITSIIITKKKNLNLL